MVPMETEMEVEVAGGTKLRPVVHPWRRRILVGTGAIHRLRLTSPRV